ncbi:MAG: PLP-dependent aminotransferase family protein [Acidimicrobiales bacterium]
MPTKLGPQEGPAALNPLIADLRSSAIRDLLALTQAPGVLSLAGGLPAADTFPADAVSAAAARLLAGDPAAALQYATTEGHPLLRAWIARYEAARSGREVDPDRVLVTSGSQQALDLLIRTLCAPGAVVAVEEPGYLGALQALRAAGASLRPFPVDAEGLDVEALAEALAGGLRPVALYTVATHQNPTGVTLSAERRRTLGELADRYGFVVIEDDPYAELWFEAPPPPPIRRATEWAVTLGSFSKTVAPGLRVGWAVLPDALHAPMVRLKQAADLQAGTFSQALVAALVTDEHWWSDHLVRLRSVYAQRAGALAGALAERFGDSLALNRPLGGMFLWGRFTDGADAAEVLRAALERHVAFVPGAEFFTGPPDRGAVRLSFATNPPAQLAEAAARLARAHEQATRRRPPAP